MKKLLALLLCLSMTLCITPFVASAADETATAATPTGTAITTLAQLQEVKGSGDYYLDNDIYVDLTSVTLPLIADANAFTGNLDGNGHSILFKNADGTTQSKVNTDKTTNEITLTVSGGILFTTYKAKSIKNLTMGSKDAPANVTLNKTGGTNFGVIAQNVFCEGFRPVFENVTVYGNISQNKKDTAFNSGLFYATAQNNMYMVNCKAEGSIAVNTGAANVGGFIGIYRPATTNSLSLRMLKCVSNVSFSTYNSVTASSSSAFGGLIGALRLASGDTVHDKLEAYNCLVIGSLPGLTDNEDALCGYNAGAASNCVNVNSASLAMLADGLALTTDRVASFRFNSPTGIRFRTTVSGLYDTLVSYYGAENVKLGTVIAPKLFVDDAAAFTKDALDDLTGISSEKYTDVSFGGEWYSESESTNLWNDATPIMAVTKHTYTGSIANIYEANYDVDFCAIGYISYRENAQADWTTIYADYATVEGSEGIPAFSIRDLADAAYQEMDKYTVAEQEAINKYRTKQ